MRAHGSLTVCFSKETDEGWRAEGRTGWGGQATYPNLAIKTAVTLCAVFPLGAAPDRRLDRLHPATAWP